MTKEVEKKKVNHKNDKTKAKKNKKESAKSNAVVNDNRIHFFVKGRKMDLGLVAIVLILVTVGLIMLLSASAPYALRTENDSYFYFTKQLKFAIAGIVLMFIISKIDYRILNSRISYLAYIAGLGFMSLVLVPGIGVRRNDALRWIKLFGIQFQPSEIMKICFIILIAYLICKKSDEIKKFWAGLVPILFTFVPVLALLYVQEHLSAMMITAIILFVLLLISKARILHLIPVGIAGFIGAGLYTFSSDFRRRRLLTFLDPWQDSLDSGWQIIQSLYAISSGGLFGVGLGQGVQKYMYISEPQNDFILATWAEEMGLFGVLFIIVLFILFVWKGCRIAMKSQDLFGTLLAAGITTMVGIQAVFNIAVVTSSMPVTGISLPFCSYGGTSLLVLLMSIGLLLSVSRFGTVKEEE